MKTLSTLALFFLLLSSNNTIFAWTSSNEGVCYTMDTLVLLSEDIIYNIADQMFEVDCDIVILENDTLKILFGETVKFISYFEPYSIRFGIKIFGCIIAKGTKNQPIHLGDPETSFTPNSGYWWNGIEIINTSNNGESEIRYCTLRGVTNIGNLKETAIYCENSSPIIDHCTFTIMGTSTEEGGCSAIGLFEQSYPIVSFCTFKNIMRGVAIWCNPFAPQDTVYFPSPLAIGCNINSSVQGFHWPQCLYDHVILYGGFLDNCYFGVGSVFCDTTLGNPVDTTGDGICNTTSTYELQPRFLLVDGVVNPRSDPLITGINEDETAILPTTSKYIVLNNNYPNPFSNFTTIEFIITDRISNINLMIVDAKGNIINQLVNNELFSHGKHQVNWNGNNSSGQKVPEGIYFYKLMDGKNLIVKKVIVVK